jgi:nucleoside-diphosphate-sugar epimerase
MLRVFGRASQWGSVFSKKAPDVTPEIAYLLGVDMPCGHAKATRELGYQAASMEEMIKDTYDWLLADGRI